MHKIEFINHASVLISNGDVSILSDPWYQDSVFNEGWGLLDKFDDDDIRDILNRTNFIWLSHEHPDHFSVSFFNKFKEFIIAKNIKILFQKTRDSRVVNFLKSKGFEVLELDDNKNLDLADNFKIKVIKVDFYDSALILDLDGIKIANLNDCPFESDFQLKTFASKSGNIDLLLTQFSYAAWKGGKANIAWRKSAALEKLKIMKKQSHYLNCKKIIPFASFIYFSNSSNFYLNDSVNTPEKIVNFFKNTNFEIIFMKPFEKQNLKNISQSTPSINFWNQKFENIKNLIPQDYTKSFSMDDLMNEFKIYKSKLCLKNNYILMNILILLKPFGIFSSIKIKLEDLNQVLIYSLHSGLKESDKTDFDISLHSNSLMFIFKNEFGFDTLTVNGNFECGKEGFSKMVKSFAIGSLNAMGLSISILSILNPFVFLLLIRKLSRVNSNLE